MTPARGRAIAGALALTAASAVWTLAGAPPASAYVCALGIDSPAAGSISGASTLHVTGPFVARQGIADRSVEVTFTQSPGAPPAAVTVSGAAVGPADRFDVPVGPLARNGRYTIRVLARHAGMAALLSCADGIGPEQRDTERTAEVSFAVSVQALPPGNVAARFDAGARRAVVSWDKSADPDVAGYTISRAIGGDAPTLVQVPADPQSWIDTSLPDGAATITYAVQASRNGPEPGKTSLPSPPVSVRLEIAAAPATPTSTKAPAPGGGGGTSPPTTRPFVLGLPVGGSPLGGLAEPSVPGPTADPTPAPPDDGTYRPLLPYQPGDAADGAPSSGDPAVVGRSSDGGDGPPQLAYVASGLLTGVVAAQVLWLRRQSLHPGRAGAQGTSDPLEPVEPAGPQAADPARPDPDAGVFAAPASAAAAGAAVREPAAAGLAAMAAAARPTKGASEVEGGAAGATPGTSAGTSGPLASDGRGAGTGTTVTVGRGPVEDAATPETETAGAHAGATPEGTVAGGAGEVDADRLHQGTETGVASGAEPDPAGQRPTTGPGAGGRAGSASGSDGNEAVRSLAAAMSAPVAGVILRPSRDGSGGFEPVGAAEADQPGETGAPATAARRGRPLRSPTRAAGRPDREQEQMPEAARRRRPLGRPARAPAEPVEAAAGLPAAAGDPVAGRRRPLRSPTRVPPSPAASPPPEAEPTPSGAVDAPISRRRPPRRRRPLRSADRVAAESSEDRSTPPATTSEPVGRRRPLRSAERVPAGPPADESMPAVTALVPVARRRPLPSAEGAPAEATAALMAAPVPPGNEGPTPPARPAVRRPLRSPTRPAVAPTASPVADREAVDPATALRAAPTLEGAAPGWAKPEPDLLDAATAPRTVAATEEVRREPAGSAATSPQRPADDASSPPRPAPTGRRAEGPLPVKPAVAAPVDAGEAPVEPRGRGWVEAVPLPGRELEVAASRPIWEPSADPVPVRLPPAAEAWMSEPPARPSLEEGATAAPAGAWPGERRSWEAMVRPRRRRIATLSRSEAPPAWPALASATDPDEQPVPATFNGADARAADQQRVGEGDPHPDKLLLILKPEGGGPG